MTTRPFDPANYLTTPELRAAYLGLIAESGDMRRFVRALDDIVRSHNKSALARRSGMTRQGLDKAFAEGANPTLDTVVKVSASLGLGIKFVPLKTAKRAAPVPARYGRKAVETTKPAKAA